MVLVPFESAFKALANGTKIIKIRQILILIRTKVQKVMRFFVSYKIQKIFCNIPSKVTNMKRKLISDDAGIFSFCLIFSCVFY